eukprot:m.378302 g.378302  ORF g.378302 m.378302 type:complete len:56 (+) comp20929_c0_seq2:2558-2725(+)
MKVSAPVRVYQQQSIKISATSLTHKNSSPAPRVGACAFANLLLCTCANPPTPIPI